MTSEIRPPPRGRKPADQRSKLADSRTPRANQMKLLAHSTVKKLYITKIGENQKKRICARRLSRPWLIGGLRKIVIERQFRKPSRNGFEQSFGARGAKAVPEKLIDFF
jgi:hypothetical protein